MHISVSQKADAVIAAVAGTSRFDALRAARLFCNSNGAFVHWVEKTGADTQAIRDARVLQHAWKRFGRARSRLITIRAVKAAIRKALQNAGMRLTKAAVLALLDSPKIIKHRGDRAQRASQQLDLLFNSLIRA